MQTADAVVIGAGINGAATAYNLVRRGMKRVVLLDRHVIAAGGTGKSAAIVRQHYSTPQLAAMVKRAVDIFADFDEVIGGDAGYVACGWAFLVPDYVSDGFVQNLAMQQRLGIDTGEISKDELLAIEPRLQLDDVHRIAYEPGSGYADPIATTHAYVHRFRELGGDLRQMTTATGLTVAGGAVKAVQIGEDQIATCGGPPKLAFSDMAQAVYYRPDGATRTLFGRGYPKQYEHVAADSYNESADNDFIVEAHARLIRRIPSFKDAIFIRAFAGLYDVTPDWHPILGVVDHVRGLHLCAGFSGHGFKIGPAIGEVMADLIMSGQSSIDVSTLGLGRFANNELVASAYGGNRA